MTTRLALNLFDRNPWLAILGACLAVWAMVICGCFGGIGDG